MARPGQRGFEERLIAKAGPPAVLLSRRPGAVVLSGISTRMRESPDSAIALTERVAAALTARGIDARTAPRAETEDFCTPPVGAGRNATQCALRDDVGLIALVGYPWSTKSGVLVKITIVADSRLRSGRPVVSLDALVENRDGAWRVVYIERTRRASE